MLLIIISCVASYLVGALPFGLWIGLAWKGVDVRTLGSGNIGATNVLRVLGPGPAAVSFLLDVAKGAFGILLARALWSAAPALRGEMPLWLPVLAIVGAFAVLGHSFSPFLRFTGGKGVAASLGMFLALCPPVAIVGLLSWLAVVGVTRYVSLASIVAALSLPFAAYFTQGVYSHGTADWVWMLGISAVMAVLVIVRHRANIERLIAHTEPKLGEKRGQPAEAE